MFSDQQLASAHASASALEQLARTHWLASQADVPERDAALVAVRHVTALKKSLEQWMAARHARAALKT